MVLLNQLLGHWEPLWLFLILTGELFFGVATFVILVKEYWYDKEFNENIKAARKERRRKKYEMTLPEEGLTEGEMR